MTRIPLTLGKHFLLIDSPISFYLVDNEENSVYRPSGVWQLDTWKLLPEKYQKDHPVYTLSIDYDESKLADGKEVVIRESDIDLGDGVAGVSGQAVMLTGINDSLLPISVAVSNLPDNQKVNVSNFPDNQKVNVSNFPDNQNVNVSNFPDNQNVNVSNFPDNQKVNVSNFPVVQNVAVLSDLRCDFYPLDGSEESSFSAFLTWFSSFTGFIYSLIFKTQDGNSTVNNVVKNFSVVNADGVSYVAFVAQNSMNPGLVYYVVPSVDVEVTALYRDK